MNIEIKLKWCELSKIVKAIGEATGALDLALQLNAQTSHLNLQPHQAEGLTRMLANLREAGDIVSQSIRHPELPSEAEIKTKCIELLKRRDEDARRDGGWPGLERLEALAFVEGVRYCLEDVAPIQKEQEPEDNADS